MARAVNQSLHCATTLFAILFWGSAAAPAQTPTTPTNSKQHQTPSKTAPTQAGEKTFILVGAGDIAGCKALEGAKTTAKLIEKIPGTVFAAGDLAYEGGSPDEFEFCYGPTWGRFKDRTKPAMGNHEYVNPTAHGYFDYWGSKAGPRGKGYYSYDLGNWHIIVLNTNCYSQILGGCAAGSSEEKWLKQDLVAHANSCLIAYGHHALFSSGIFKKHALHPELKTMWEDLYAAHADLVLAGHEHAYERFAPQNPNGDPDAKNGIREIVVGTGGRSHDPLGFATPNSEVREWQTYGVLKLTLSPTKYSWEFIPEEGKTFSDSGSAACHNATNN